MNVRLCQRCGNRFYAGPRGQAKYCSKSCRVSNSGDPARFYKQGIYLSKSGRYEHYDSAFEELWMKVADEKGIKWFRATSIRIPYWNPRLKRQAVYQPDFIIKSKTGDRLIELKPYSMINDQVNQAKFEAARKWCREHGLEFEVITSAYQQ